MNRIIKVSEYLSAGLLILLSILILVQVILRNFLGWGFVWSEEMARYLLLTMVLLMSPALFLRDEHVGIDFIAKIIPKKSVKYYRVLIIVLILFFYCLYIVSHLNFVGQMGNVRTPSLNMSNFWFFMAGLVGAVLGAAVGFFKLIKLLLSGVKR
ncbi:MAG: TRAP transporter small permease subunit [Spirochaetales bacterium]|nr:TRAP transporter small permease subunit [Spirochaetales bacterium]